MLGISWGISTNPSVCSNCPCPCSCFCSRPFSTEFLLFLMLEEWTLGGRSDLYLQNLCSWGWILLRGMALLRNCILLRSCYEQLIDVPICPQFLLSSIYDSNNVYTCSRMFIYQEQARICQPAHCSPSGFFYGLRLASSAPFSDFDDRSNWFYSMSSMGSFSSFFSLSRVLMQLAGSSPLSSDFSFFFWVIWQISLSALILMVFLSNSDPSSESLKPRKMSSSFQLALVPLARAALLPCPSTDLFSFRMFCMELIRLLSGLSFLLFLVGSMSSLVNISTSSNTLISGSSSGSSDDEADSSGFLLRLQRSEYRLFTDFSFLAFSCTAFYWGDKTFSRFYGEGDFLRIRLGGGTYFFFGGFFISSLFFFMGELFLLSFWVIFALERIFC